MRFSRARAGSLAALATFIVGCGGAPPTPTPPNANQFAYVAAPNERNLSWYSVADSSGKLRPEGYVQEVARATRIDLVDAHKLILTDGDARITSYSRNLTTGRPRWLGEVRDVNHYAVSPQGDLVVASKHTGAGVEAYRITDTGVDSTPVGSVPMPLATQLTTLFYHPTGRWVYGPKGNTLKRLAVDPNASASLTLLSDAYTDPNGDSVKDVVFERQGWRALLVFASRVVRVDVATDGSMTPRFSPLSIGPLIGARVHPSGNWLFAIEGGALKTRRLDPDFVPSATPTSSAGVAVGGYDWNSSGDTVTTTFPDHYIENNRFNVSTGAFTQLAFQYDGWGHNAIALSAGSNYANKSELVALVINKTDSSIQSFKVIPDGTLTLVSTLPSGGTSPSGLAVSPLDPFVYVAHEGSGDVSAFSVNTSSGALSSVGSPVPAGAQPAAITTEPSGRFVYVANAGDDTVSILAIDPMTGALSTARAAQATVASHPSALAADPLGRLLYVGSSAQSGPAVEVFQLGSGGRLVPRTQLMGTGAGVLAGASGLSLDPYGELLFSNYSGTSGTIGYCAIVGLTPNCAGNLNTAAGPLLPRSISVAGRRRRAFVLGNVPNSPLFFVAPYDYGTQFSVGNPFPNPLQMPTTFSSIFTDPAQIVSSYSGDWQYVIERSRNRIALFDADAHNELTLRSSFTTGNGPVAMAFVRAIE